MQTALNTSLHAAATAGESGKKAGWQKPANWPDIRQIPAGSIAFLVTNAYPAFGVTVTSTSGYGVYINGVKHADYAEGAKKCALVLAQLPQTPFIINDYNAFKIEIRPAAGGSITKILTAFAQGLAEYQGVLWAHFNTQNAVDISNFAYYAVGTLKHARWDATLEAITARNNTLKPLAFSTPWLECRQLKSVPELDFSAATGAFAPWAMCAACKEFTFKNTPSGSMSMFNIFSQYNMPAELEKINLHNFNTAAVRDWFNCHAYAHKLKRLPAYNYAGAENMESFLTEGVSLQDTALDLSAACNLKFLSVYGTAQKRMDGLKEVLVSPLAPFSTGITPITLKYTGLGRAAIRALFASLPAIKSKSIDITATPGAAELDAQDIALATSKGWNVVRDNF